MLTDTNSAWLEAFKSKYGYAPRILHIGNIANNSYNNAKLLNQAGFSNDVICYDYYHVMASPEWEDAEFVGEISDQFKPDWTKVNLNGFVRPKWFAQGVLFDCVDYLRRNRTRKNTSVSWKRLEKASRQLDGSRLERRIAFLRNALQKGLFIFSSKQSSAFCFLRQGFTRRFGNLVGPLIAYTLTVLIWPFMHPLIRISGKGRMECERAIQKCLDDWHAEFPEREPLTQIELQKFIYTSSRFMAEWRSLFACYDIVLAYSTDPIIPMLSEVPYFAFEHGTIREIPFKNDVLGKVTALSYRKAEHVFVTNFDCLPNAKILSPEKFTLINHPYDEDHGLSVVGYEGLRSSLQLQLDADFLFFFPTRQDWVHGTGYADKANDVFWRAFGALVREGWKVGVICCEWGKNIEESRDLIEREGGAGKVLWVKPMANVNFERMARACDIVVDQFKLGAFGGVVFKAMAVGAPILTYLEASKLLDQYSEMPPIVNCESSKEIVEKISLLLHNRHEIHRLGEASRSWIKRHHAKQATVNLQVDQFRNFLSSKQAIDSVKQPEQLGIYDRPH